MEVMTQGLGVIRVTIVEIHQSVHNQIQISIDAGLLGTLCWLFSLQAQNFFFLLTEPKLHCTFELGIFRGKKCTLSNVNYIPSSQEESEQSAHPICHWASVLLTMTAWSPNSIMILLCLQSTSFLLIIYITMQCMSHIVYCSIQVTIVYQITDYVNWWINIDFTLKLPLMSSVISVTSGCWSLSAPCYSPCSESLSVLHADGFQFVHCPNHPIHFTHEHVLGIIILLLPLCLFCS